MNLDLRTYLPLAITNQAGTGMEQHPARQRNAGGRPAASADGFSRADPNTTATLAPLTLRPALSSGRSYSGGLSDPVLSARGAQGKRAVAAPLPPIGKVKSRSDGNASGMARQARANAILGSLRLSAEQLRIVQSALEGHSFFFTGAAGTGKSHVLRELVRALKELHEPSSIFVTAPTGVRFRFLAHNFRLLLSRSANFSFPSIWVAQLAHLWQSTVFWATVVSDDLVVYGVPIDLIDFNGLICLQ